MSGGVEEGGVTGAEGEASEDAVALLVCEGREVNDLDSAEGGRGKELEVADVLAAELVRLTGSLDGGVAYMLGEGVPAEGLATTLGVLELPKGEREVGVSAAEELAGVEAGDPLVRRGSKEAKSSEDRSRSPEEEGL